MSQFLLFSSLAFGALAHPLAELLPRATSAASGAIPKATAWNPPSGMETALDQVWKQTVKENAAWSDNKDYILDQLMANNGSINYCVRWNTDYTSTEANRTKTASALQRSLEKWVSDTSTLQPRRSRRYNQLTRSRSMSLLTSMDSH